MKTLTQPLVPSLLKCLVFLIMIFLYQKASSQNLSNEALYANGYKEYSVSDWVYASVYLYAYIQRNPKEFKDPNFKKEVVQCYDYTVGQLNFMVQDYNRLLTAKNQKHNGIGNSTQGLRVSAPILRRPEEKPKF